MCGARLLRSPRGAGGGGWREVRACMGSEDAAMAESVKEVGGLCVVLACCALPGKRGVGGGGRCVHAWGLRTRQWLRASRR